MDGIQRVGYPRGVDALSLALLGENGTFRMENHLSFTLQRPQRERRALTGT